MPRQMSEGQRSYEAKRAAKAGVSMEKWLSQKDKERQKEERERQQATRPPPAPKKPGFFSRLIAKAEKPL